MSIRRFFTEYLNKQANENVLVEGWTEYYSNGPYTASMDDDAFSQFDGEMFPMDFTIERAGERIKEIRGLANARNYIDALVKQETKGITYPCLVDFEKGFGYGTRSSGDYQAVGETIRGIHTWELEDYSYGDDTWFNFACLDKNINIYGSIIFKEYGTCTISTAFKLRNETEDRLYADLSAAGLTSANLANEQVDFFNLDTIAVRACNSEEAVDALVNRIVEIDRKLDYYLGLYNKHIKDEFGVDVKVTL